MRDLQVWRVDHFIAIKNQIEIQRARRARTKTLASAFALDLQQGAKNIVRPERCPPDDRAVQKARLRLDANRVGLVEAGRHDIGQNVLQSSDGEVDVRLSIADVAADGNCDVIQSSGCR